jgi:hypothetical protein
LLPGFIRRRSSFTDAVTRAQRESVTANAAIEWLREALAA